MKIRRIGKYECLWAVRYECTEASFRPMLQGRCYRLLDLPTNSLPKSLQLKTLLKPIGSACDFKGPAISYK